MPKTTDAGNDSCEQNQQERSDCKNICNQCADQRSMETNSEFQHRRNNSAAQQYQQLDDCGHDCQYRQQRKPDDTSAIALILALVSPSFPFQGRRVGWTQQHVIGYGITDARSKKTEFVFVAGKAVVVESGSKGGFRTRIQKQQWIVDAIVIDTPPKGCFRCRSHGSGSPEGYHLYVTHFEGCQLLRCQAGDQRTLGMGNVHHDSVFSSSLDRSDGLSEVFYQTVHLRCDSTEVLLLPGLRQVAEVPAGILFVHHLGGVVIKLDLLASKEPGDLWCFQFHVARVVTDSVHPCQSCFWSESKETGIVFGAIDDGNNRGSDYKKEHPQSNCHPIRRHDRSPRS
mmetsp:Transcript_27338/g.60375  ORF Transcript_27338/g.60375 Transcript_27338/m.60375 type:complete len:341 (+) Transcript_27338:1887-2909(+)